MNAIISLLSSLKDGQKLTLAIEESVDEDEDGFYYAACILDKEDKAIVGVTAEIEDGEVFERLTVNMLAAHRKRG